MADAGLIPSLPPCPVCGAVGTLEVTSVLRCRPRGTWSLSGCQAKLAAVEVPVLRCFTAGCGFVELAREG